MTDKVTFDDIKKANEAIIPTAISHKAKNGKTVSNDYAPVNQRIKAFRMVHPNGAIKTHIVSMADGVVVMTAKVYDENGWLLGTGTAYEKESSTFINQTSYIENCETSAVGRALGMCGFGVDTSVASAEEMENALHEQAENDGITEAMVKTLETCIPKHGQTVEAVCKHYKVDSLAGLTVGQFKELMDKMGEQDGKVDR